MELIVLARFGSRPFQVWKSNDVEADPAWRTWTFEVQMLQPAETEIAIAVALTHDIADDVKAFANNSLPSVGRLFIARPISGATSRSVARGRHAFDLAQAAIRMKREKTQDGGTIHLFIAASNAFTFFLGQRQASLDAWRCTSLILKDKKGGGYTTFLSLPVLPGKA